MAKINSLSVLVDGSSPEAKEFLAEKYAGVIANVQKITTSGRIKNTDLSGDPESGTLVAKRFVNATSQNYGTARTAGKGNAVKDKEVVIPIDQDKEFVEEIEEKDVKLLGVEGLIDKRSRNHTLRMAAELDEKFYAQAETEGTKFAPAEGVTAIQDIVESSIVTTSEEFFSYHGVKVFSSTRLPKDVKFMTMMDGSVAQPVMSHPYKAERIPLSDAIALELFFYYGTKAVTPETILYYTGA